MITPFQYRQEDRFREEANNRKLKELYKNGDYVGLLDFALLLSHEASYKNSAMFWAMQDSLIANRPDSAKVQSEHQSALVDETIEKLIELKEQRRKSEEDASALTHISESA
jgi:hypothetical protein